MIYGCITIALTAFTVDTLTNTSFVVFSSGVPSSSTAPGFGSLLPRVKADTEPREALEWCVCDEWTNMFALPAVRFPVLSSRVPGFWGSGVLSRVRPFPSFVLLLLLVFCSPGFWVSGGVFPAGGDIHAPSAAHFSSASRLKLGRHS